MGEGLSGLYAGFPGASLNIAAQSLIYFYSFTLFRNIYKLQVGKNQREVLGTVTELSLGAAAGTITQLLTTPMSVIAVRQQVDQKREKQGILSTLSAVISSEPQGWKALWQGLGPSLLLVANPAFTYAAYQRLKTIFLSRDTDKMCPILIFRNSTPFRPPRKVGLS